MPQPAVQDEHSPAAIWTNVTEKLQQVLPRQSFLTWFKPIKAESFDGEILTLCIPSRFYYDWIDGHYSDYLKDAIQDVLKKTVEVRYVVNPNGTPDPDHYPASSIKPREKVPLILTEDFETHLNPRYVFNNFIEGDCNKFALAAATALSRKPGDTPFNPLLIYGNSGLGKTHLIQAIGNFIVLNGIARQVLYVTSEQFTSDFVKGIQTGRSENFSRLYRNVDVLLLDDVQFFMAKEKTQEEFFHTFNSLHHAGKQLVFSSDRPPRDLEGFDERLVSRLQWGLISELKMPEYETRLAILNSRSEEEKVNLPEDVAHYIAMNITDNVRSLQGALIHILAQSSLIGNDISIGLARNVLRNLTNRPQKPISIERIQEITANEFGIPSDLIRLKTRKKEIVKARQIAMYLATELTRHTLKAIGLHFGGRDHSTVIHSRETVVELIQIDTELASVIEDLRRKIELSSF